MLRNSVRLHDATFRFARHQAQSECIRITLSDGPQVTTGPENDLS